MSVSNKFLFRSFLVGSLLVTPLAARAAAGDVVLFTSLRERRVRPVVAPFEQSSGLSVRVVHVRRPNRSRAKALLAEFGKSKADVWWCQEVLATDALKRAGAFVRLTPAPAGADASGLDDAGGLWFGFAPRARILIVNTDKVPERERPKSMWDLLAPRFKNQVLLAKPSSGTALFHLLALRQALGEVETQRYLDGLSHNGCRVVASDRRLAETIGRGEALVGMTDTSDCRAAAAKGLPVAAIYPDQDGAGTLLVPHTVAWLASSGNPTGARQLIEYLLSARAERVLTSKGRGQLALRAGAGAQSVDELRVMKVDLGAAAALESTFGAALGEGYATGTVTIDFDHMPAGKPPAGMTVTQTGSGPLGVWTVSEDPSSTDGGRVVTQTDATGTGHRFPLCIYDGFSAKDVSVSVDFKTMTGDTDRAAGLCVRYLDKDNYYCCRANSLEDNYRFYRIVDGRRFEIGGVNHVPILEGIWQSMRLDARGSHFRMWLNGALAFEVDDDTFSGPGKVGLWLKGDSVTSFDDLRISPPGSRHESTFEGKQPGAEPQGFVVRATRGDPVPWRIVAAAGAKTGGMAVTPDAQDPSAGRRGGSALLDEATVAKDVSVFTRFKVATTGRGMHLAGLVARFVDANDYYYVRINPEECNLRLYHMRNGQRKLVGERHHTKHDEHKWHTAQLTVIGSRFEVLIDGKLQFAAHDPEPPSAGRAGVWAASGGRTLFDEIAVEAWN